jgi:hypothetical protein
VDVQHLHIQVAEITEMLESDSNNLEALEISHALRQPHIDSIDGSLHQVRQLAALLLLCAFLLI